MLKIIQSYMELDYGAIFAIYEESLQKEFTEERLLEDIKLSLHKHDGKLLLWDHNGKYVAAVRCEPYLDGYLIYGLETTPDYRKSGFATKLFKATIQYFAPQEKRLYSHIHKRNKPSLKLHEKLGVVEANDFAKLIDGTISQNYKTVVYVNKNTDMAK